MVIDTETTGLQSGVEKENGDVGCTKLYRTGTIQTGEKIVKLMGLVGDLPRAELFARQKTAGWDARGNEVDSSITL